MSYLVYSTEAIVLGRRDYGDSSVSVRLLSKDFGALWVMVISGNKSVKLSNSLQVGSQGIYDFVRGKTGFRLTGVKPHKSLQAKTFGSEQIGFVRMATAYIMRFVPDDESIDRELYTLCLDMLQFAEKNEWSDVWWNSFRYRLLKSLGYIPDGIESNLTKQTVERLILDAELAAQL